MTVWKNMSTDEKTFNRLSTVRGVLEYHSQRKITHSETFRFLLGIWDGLEEKVKLMLLEGI